MSKTKFTEKVIESIMNPIYKRTHIIKEAQELSYTTFCGLDLTFADINDGTAKAEVINGGQTRAEARKVKCVNCMSEKIKDILASPSWHDYNSVYFVFTTKLNELGAELETDLHKCFPFNQIKLTPPSKPQICNLSVEPNKWFLFYKGFIYGNEPTDVHTRINNKVLIDEKYKKYAPQAF